MKTTTLATVLVMTAAVAAAWLAATPRASVPAQAEPEVQRVIVIGKRLSAAEAAAEASAPTVVARFN
ncbi:hypothetical protein [uncultured Aquincola sp.]|uniref:hypothetical protein n=1 Tax=uncultured Aquincola sp. TaxID=886556 RepID=UPI0032B2D671